MTPLPLLLLALSVLSQEPLAVPAQETLPGPAGGLVVLNKAEASASLLDLASGEERARLPVGVGPHEVAVSPDGHLAVVANYGTQVAGSSLTLLDLVAEKPLRTLDLGAAARPHGIVFDPDGAHVWVTAEERGELLRVRVGDGAVVAAAPTPQPVGHMVVYGDAGFLYVSAIGGGGITRVRPTDDGWKSDDFIPTGAGAEGLCFSPRDGSLWVGNRGADTLTVLDAASLKTLATVPAEGFPIRAATTPDGAMVVVSCARAGLLRFYAVHSRLETGAPLDFGVQVKADRAGGRLLDDFGDSPVPIGIVMPPLSATAYVALANADRIAEVDLPTRTVKRWLRAGREPDGMAWYPAP